MSGASIAFKAAANMALHHEDDSKLSFGVVEEYHLNEQHFTRSIQIPVQGRVCLQVFAINGREIPQEQEWLDQLQMARQRILSLK